ncbi:MAG: hypothetical protein R8J94_14930 [Acidimicrobiia bacterium]|nr:hypothetical protein [Acidimicrobiia bacterium]
MSLIVIAIGISLLTVPALTAKGSLAPPAQVRTACVAAVAGMWLLWLGSLLTASPLLLWWHDGLSVSSVGIAHLSPGGPWAWTAGGIGGGIGASYIVATLRRTIRARRRAALPRWAADTFAHDASAGAEVRVAPTLEPIAFAVPGRDRHVVASRAVMLLPGPERRAVLAHEGAHLRLRHDRHLLVLTTYERVWGWLPGVRAVALCHRTSIEHWADTIASRTTPTDLTLERARMKLGACPGASPVASRTNPPSQSSGWQLVGVLAFVGALVVAGAYSASHTFGDLSDVLAALH